MGGVDPETVGAEGVGAIEVTLVEDGVGSEDPETRVGSRLVVGTGKVVCDTD